MKKILYTFLSLMFAVSANGQLTNNGATIVVESGATLVVESNITNTGTMTNSGTIIVEGDFDNTGGTITSSASTSKIVFTGTDAATLTLDAPTTVYEIEMDKTANNVTLAGDDLTVTNDLHFVQDNNKFDVNGNKLTIGAAGSTTIDGAVTGSYIIADGDASATSLVSKVVIADETFTYEIGDATNYTPLEAVITGSAYSAAALDVNTVGMKQANVPTDADDFINRYWNVDQAGITDPSITLTGTYVAGDLESGATAADVKGAHYTGSDWTYLAAAAGTNEVTGTIEESGDFTGTNSFGRVGLKVMLDGAFSGGTLSNTLNTMGLLPTTSPYGGGETVDAGFFTANTDIVDWIEFETRNSATPATVEGTGVGFVKTDGTVVGLDGATDPFLKDAGTTGYVVIKHRNHLSVCTGASIDLDGSAALQDFTDSGYSAYGTNGLRNNGGTMTMWAGDANGDEEVIYVGATTDVTPISSEVFLNPLNTGFSASFPFSGYNLGDTNMDGVTIYVGATTDVTPISTSTFLNPLNTGFSASFPLTAQIPE